MLKWGDAEVGGRLAGEDSGARGRGLGPMPRPHPLLRPRLPPFRLHCARSVLGAASDYSRA